MGKKKYHKKDAVAMKNYRERNGVKGLRVYHCGFCNLFHLTHQKYDKGGFGQKNKRAYTN
jgi:hypothetical protein